jgi:hypothetical protein
MRSLCVVEIDVEVDHCPDSKHRQVGVQKHLLVLDARSESFNEHIVPPRASAVHRLID